MSSKIYPYIRPVSMGAILFFAGFAVGLIVFRAWSIERNPVIMDGIKSGEDQLKWAEQSFFVQKLTGQRLRKDDGKRFSENLRNALDKALVDPERSAREYQTKRILGGVDLGNLDDVVAYLDQMVPGPPRDLALFALLERWGELDGRTALTFALSRTDYWQKPEAVVATLRGWTRVEASAAWDWALINPGDDPFVSESMNAVLLEVARSNPDTAVELALSIPDEAKATSAMRQLVDFAFEQGNMSSLESLMTEVPEESLIARVVIPYFAERWSRFEPALAAEWALNQISVEYRAEALASITQNWAGNFPEAAATWALTLPSGKDRMESLAGVSRQWIELEGPNGAADWLNQYPSDPDFDLAVREVALSMMVENVAAAVTWAESITDPQMRGATLSMMGDFEEPTGLSGVELKMDSNAMSGKERFEDNGLSREIEAGSPIEIKEGQTLEVVIPIEGGGNTDGGG